MDLSIIIVNWNSVDYVRKCLGSIYTQTKDINFEVIVVDNASYDGCNQVLANEFPEAKFVQSDKNLGFAGANNLGFNHSTGMNLLFLNPDTEVVGSAIKVMLSHLQSIPDAGALGCRLLNSNLSLQTSCIQPFPTILNQILDIEYLKRIFPKLEFWGTKPLFLTNGKPEKVEVVSGACIMTKRLIFENIGMFSTDYFMYTEDIDLCYKILQAGYKIYHIKDATVVHHGGGSSTRAKVNNLNDVLKRESISCFLEKTDGRFTANLYRYSMGVSSIIRLIILAVLTPAAVLLGHTDSLYPKLLRWKKVLEWSLGREKWARALNRNKERHCL
jgi:hypothetical protein